MYLSKSLAKATACETYFAQQLNQNADKSVTILHPAALTGTQFHNYKSSYINHLVESSQTEDKGWVESWMHRVFLNEDAATLIARDKEGFRIDPENTYATELYLSCDSTGHPVEMESGATPGRLAKHPDSALGGTLDWLELEGKTARIIDWKTAYAPIPSEEESAIYSYLVFSRFPQVEQVDFCWFFVRLWRWETVSYMRSEYKTVLASKVASIWKRYRDLVEKIAANQPLTIDPFAGLCPFCYVRCPGYAAFDGQLSPAPIQNYVDATHAAQVIYLARTFADKAEVMLKKYLGRMGPVQVGEFRAELKTDIVRKYPLVPALSVLGMSLSDPEAQQSTQWDVPLDGLAVSGLSGYAKARKRAGLSEELEEIAQTSTRTRLVFSRNGNALNDSLEEHKIVEITEGTEKENL